MAERLQILVADEDPVTRMLLCQYLAELGHKVVAEAGTGREVLRLAEETDLDLILMDVAMPELDGLSAAARVGERRPVPIIVLSAYTTPLILQQACNQLVMAYLVKPVKPTDLEPAIQIALARFYDLVAWVQRAESLSHEVSERIVLEQAKGILMERYGGDSASAEQRLQELAQEQSTTPIAAAQVLVEAVINRKQAGFPTHGGAEEVESHP